MNDLVEYARKLLFIAYKYGGKHPAEGLDCSGLVEILMKFASINPPGDHNAQSYFNLFHVVGTPLFGDPDIGALIFYGKTISTIDHVAFIATKNTVIEAGGGDHTTLTLQDAIERRAYVRERYINDPHARIDRIAIVMPPYPNWMLN